MAFEVEAYHAGCGGRFWYDEPGTYKLEDGSVVETNWFRCGACNYTASEGLLDSSLVAMWPDFEDYECDPL